MLCRRFYLSRMSLFRGFLQSIPSEKTIEEERRYGPGNGEE